LTVSSLQYILIVIKNSQGMHLNIEYYSVRDSLPGQDHQSNQQNALNKQSTYAFQPEFVKDFLVPIERKGFF